jgi:hypothetical protein
MAKQTINLPGGFTVSGVTNDEAKVLAGRGRFVEKYCAEKGWDLNRLTIEQLLEIRSQSGWKNPSE